MGRPVVFFVDADDDERLVLEAAFETAGFDVLAAGGEREALGVLDQARVDLVIVDGELLATCSAELGQRIQSRGGAPVVLIEPSGTRVRDPVLPVEVADRVGRPVWAGELVARARLVLQRRLQEEILSLQEPERLVTEGLLAEVVAADLLRATAYHRKSGVIQLTTHDGPSALVYFRDGRVVDAEMGDLTGREAIYRLLAAREGVFAVYWGAVDRPDVVGLHPNVLVTDGLRRSVAPRPVRALQPGTVREPGVERRSTVVAGVIEDNRGTGSTAVGWAPALVPPVAPEAPVEAMTQPRQPRLKLALAGGGIGLLGVALLAVAGLARFSAREKPAAVIAAAPHAGPEGRKQPRFERIARHAPITNTPPSPASIVSTPPPSGAQVPGDLEPSPEQACRRAEARRQPPDTVEVCTRAFREAPGSAPIAAMLAHAELDRDNNGAAEEWARKALALDPTLPEGYAYLGFVAEEAGRRGEARTAYRRYLELAPTGAYAQDITAVLREELEPPGPSSRDQ